MDEKIAATILMTQLDDFLKGAAVQYTEHQEDESVAFLGYFEKGLKYQVARSLAHARLS